MEEMPKEEFEKMITEGKSKESQIVDFKTSGFIANNYDIAKWFSAFANSFGGTILIGVKDDGQLEGMKEKREHQSHIVNILRDKIEPSLNANLRIYRIGEICAYAIRVERYRILPYVVREENGSFSTYIRVGDTVRRATLLEINQLHRNASVESLEKRPELDLKLVYSGKFTDKVIASPIEDNYRIDNKEIIQTIVSDGGEGEEDLGKLVRTFLRFEKKISISKEECVPFQASIKNIGEKAAEDVKVFLSFPSNCIVLGDDDFPKNPFDISYLGLLNSSAYAPNFGGLYPNDDEPNTAAAWCSGVNNGLGRDFKEKIYVLFPKGAGKYKIKGEVFMRNFPSKKFDFDIEINPKS